MALFDCTDPARRAEGITAAVAAVGRGELVVLPTDTVYGIGGDAFDVAAVAALHAAKGRTEHPSPVLVGTRDAVDELVPDLPPAARDLIEAFWPGGLTLVVRHAPHLTWDLGGQPGTVGLRMPRDPVALELLRRTGPMAVTSANKHRLPPAPTAADARAQFGDLVSVYLELGALPTDEPSTVLTLVDDHPRVLRAGAVPVAELRRLVPDLIEPAPAR